MGRTAFEQADNAIKDAMREWVEQGADEAKALADAHSPPNDCPCCMAYKRPGFIFNARQWIRCPVCNPVYAQ